MSKFLIIFSALFLLILIGPALAPHDPNLSHLESALQAPSRQFLLGTDANGKDIFSQVLYGARLSLMISVIVVFNCLFVGIIIGYGAGYWGNGVERIFLAVADILQAFPGILLAIALAAFIPPSVFNLILLLSFVGWVSYARVVRAQVLEIKSQEYVSAGLALGVSRRRLMWRYFLPNMAGPLIVQASFGMAGVILAESTLSFLGLGLPANVPSLGKLLDSGVNLLLIAPHVSLFPGFVIMFFVLSFNLAGDWLRKRIV